MKNNSHFIAALISLYFIYGSIFSAWVLIWRPSIMAIVIAGLITGFFTGILGAKLTRLLVDDLSDMMLAEAKKKTDELIKRCIDKAERNKRSH